MKVLIVDDNPDDLIIFDHMLTMLMQYEVTRISNGLHAVELATRHSYDLFILDLDLPGLHGVEVARTLRGMEAYATTPIIFVTAYRPPNEELRGTQYNLLLQKPIFVGPMTRAIKELMETANH
jgi:CheY-like chemotaxis protein